MMPKPPIFNRRQVVLGGIALAGLTACSNSQSTAGPPSVDGATADGGGSNVAGTEASSTAIQVEAGASGAPSSPASPTPVATVAETSGRTSALPPEPSPGQPAIFVDHGPRDGTAVSLTYHASGDPALTVALLDVLKSQNVQVTVFAVGQWLAANASLGRRIVLDGHELANHTKTHQSMGSLSRAAVAAEIAGGGQALVPFIGSIGRWFRPSGIVQPTPTILAEASKIGYAYSIGYDLDTLDFQDPGAAAVVANFKRGVQPGSIVSMHFGHRGTVDATPMILDHLVTIGLRHVTLGEMFAGA